MIQNYRKTSHRTYDCKYHIVWIRKYRKKVLSGQVGIGVGELVREVFNCNNVEVLPGGHVSRDHVHLFVSVAPHLSVSKLFQYLKGKSSYKLMKENKELSKLF